MFDGNIIAFETANTERMRIDSAGNVRFEYTDASTSTSTQVPPGLRINNKDNTLGRLAGIHFSHGGAGTANAGIFHVTTNTATTSTSCRGDLAFYMKAGGASLMTESMRIQASGNVGIGTTNPLAKLSVSNDGQHGLEIEPNLFSNINRITNFNRSNNTYVGLKIDASQHQFNISGAEKMRLDSSGRLGIATTTTDWFSGDHKLVVRNNINSGSSSCVLALQDRGGQYPFIAWNADSSGTRGLILFRTSGSGGVVGSITSNGSSTTYSTSSDYRLKENVIELFDGINRVKQLQPKRFNFIADASKTVDGFLAHEAETVVPEAVTGEKDGEDMQGLDLSKLVPLLTAALQEAIAKIETLEAKFAAFEVN